MKRLYRIYAHEARLHRAIGIFYRVDDIVEARSAEEAEAIFREKYETRGGPFLVEDMDADDGADEACEARASARASARAQESEALRGPQR
jgi:hypothetical protein